MVQSNVHLIHSNMCQIVQTAMAASKTDEFAYIPAASVEKVPDAQSAPLVTSVKLLTPAIVQHSS